MTGALATELRDEIASLLPRVAKQIADPSVQPLGLLHIASGTLGVKVGTSATVETEVIRGKE